VVLTAANRGSKKSPGMTMPGLFGYSGFAPMSFQPDDAVILIS
jgi:hypothetical protein